MGREQMTDAVRAAVEQVARTHRSHLIAALAAGNGDLALAEDALSAAFEQALRTWPRRGVPDNPVAWVLTVARNRQRDVWKSAARRTSVPLGAATDAHAADSAEPQAGTGAGPIEDRRLELLFVCAHPAIDPQVHTPLMLQVVLGVDAARIAAAFAISPAAMAQRLVRAKKRIKHARIPFVVPGPQALPERLPAVLEAVYGCFAIGHDEPTTAGVELAAEAQHLATTLTTLLPDEAEVWALASLIALARARTSYGGHHIAPPEEFVPLHEQDPSHWDADLISTGESYLARAQRSRAPGRFQLEAAIQAVHCDRLRTGATDWQALHTLYRALLQVAPSLGAQVAFAAVVAQTDSVEAGLAELERIRTTWTGSRAEAVEEFQPFHAVRAHLLLAAGRPTQATAAFATAADLSRGTATRHYLASQARG